MRVEEPTPPSCPLPLLPAEVVQARAEDPGFAEVLGRARAKARGELYDPEVHHPYAPAGTGVDRVSPEGAARVRVLIAEWMERGRHRRYYDPAA